ncbi:lebercilin-like protein [Pseudomyrmex gracilis]|uniref:lebercilin-like protein n=1 Tax=Pseudomyrmex gracilis TaxID=219809 RepID=UPI000994CE8B|nr:lebercilin-like protein [Pseudomyrmex gracilis]
MQTEASILPVVQLHMHRTLTRKSKPISTLESKKLSPCRNTLFSPNKKCLNPLPGAPYKGSIKQQSLSDEQKSSRKSILGQRVMSAKMLRFKQLQNQLADAHYHLNELANENRLLKALQKRQDSALRRYEGTNAELPRLINSHHEELRVLQTKYKKLKELHKDTCNILKEKENELYTVNSQNKHLLQLSKNRHLEEREKLQLQLSDMNHKMQQQQDTIQLLHRKLALETKSLKHQLHIEICKHKETQKNLQETIEKLKSLECLLDNREKRLYYNGQLPINIKERNLVSHSLTSLKNTRLINSTDDTSDTLDDTIKRDSFHYNNDEENEEELNTRLAKDSAFQEQHVYERKSKVLRHRITDLYDSGSEDDSDEKVDANRDSSAECKTNDFPILPKYDQENPGKSIDDANRTDNSNPEIEERSIIERLKGAELQRISNNVRDNARSSENLEVSQRSSNAKKIWLEDQRSSERNEDKSLPTVSKKDTRDEARYSEDESVTHADMSHGKIRNDMLKPNSTRKEVENLPNTEREEDEEKTQQIRRKDSVTNRPDEYNNPTRDLGKENSTFKKEETLNSTQQSDVDEGTAKNNETSLGTETSLSVSSEAKDVGALLLSNNKLASHDLNEESNDAKTDVTDTRETNDRKRITYNKEKLLATMKAIDDNENIEFLSQGYKNHNAANRMQITENLYRGLPAHSKTKRDIIKDIFEDNHRENKVRGNCSKSH